jgi:hypothetical protein
LGADARVITEAPKMPVVLFAERNFILAPALVFGAALTIF